MSHEADLSVHPVRLDGAFLRRLSHCGTIGARQGRSPFSPAITRGLEAVPEEGPRWSRRLSAHTPRVSGRRAASRRARPRTRARSPAVPDDRRGWTGRSEGLRRSACAIGLNRGLCPPRCAEIHRHADLRPSMSGKADAMPSIAAKYARYLRRGSCAGRRSRASRVISVGPSHNPRPLRRLRNRPACPAMPRAGRRPRASWPTRSGVRGRADLRGNPCSRLPPGLSAPRLAHDAPSGASAGA